MKKDMLKRHKEVNIPEKYLDNDLDSLNTFDIFVTEIMSLKLYHHYLARKQIWMVEFIVLE